MKYVFNDILQNLASLLQRYINPLKLYQLNIAINTRLLIKNKLEGIGWFTYETLKRITQNQPEHQFYFIFDRPFSKEFIFSDNVHPIVIGPKARHPFLFYYWFEKAIPRVLNEIKADLFISPDGYLSLKSNIKSIAVIHDINFMHYPKDFPFVIKNYYHYFFPKFAKKATRIATVSEYSKNDIIKTFNINPDLIDVVYNGANTIYNSISEDEEEKIKSQETNGSDFFIFVGALSPRKNIKNLLLAFDQFKTKTKSKIKLVIVGEKMFKTKDIERCFQSLKAQSDIIFTGRKSPTSLKKLYGASLALTFVPYFEGFGIPMIEAMNCETAVITSNVTSMPEIAKNAALFVDPFSVDSISQGMIKLFENPNLRTELIEKGKIRAKDFSWNQTANKFWNCIERVIHE